MNNITVNKPAAISAVSFLALFITFFLVLATIGSTANAQAHAISVRGHSVLSPAPQPLSIAYAPGYDVTSVEAINLQGHYSGGLRQVDSYYWEGFNQHGQPTYKYQETYRDELTIELYNYPRDIYFSIDLHSNIINYRNAHDAAWQKAYHIANYATQAKGFNVSSVDILSFSGNYLGQYIDIGHGSWAETDIHGQQRFSFTEVARSEWTVDLYDASRAVSIKLNLQNNVISYQDPTQAFDLYNIGAAYNFDQVLMN